MLFLAIALVAFYGLARLGELLPHSQTDTAKVPVIQAIRFDRTREGSFATIQLPRTKNHNTTERPTLIINSTKDELCPIRILKEYIICRTDPKYAPGKMTLFIKAKEGPATKKVVHT